MTTLEMKNISPADQAFRVAIAVSMSVSTLLVEMEALTMALVNASALVPLVSGITAIDPLRLAFSSIKSKYAAIRFHKETHAL